MDHWHNDTMDALTPHANFNSHSFIGEHPHTADQYHGRMPHNDAFATVLHVNDTSAHAYIMKKPFFQVGEIHVTLDLGHVQHS